MKKSNLLLAVAAVAIASCSKDETTSINTGESISFRSSMDNPQSRVGQTTLATMGAFNVTAIGNNANYFTDLEVTSADGGASWAMATSYYWPQYDLSIYAYAPTDLATVSVLDAAKTIAYTTPKAITDQKDVVISHNIGTKATNEATGVEMNFKHVLAQIAVQAKCMNPQMKVDVVGVKVGSVTSQSVFTFPEEVTGAAYVLPQDSWGASLAKGSFTSGANMATAVTLTDVATSIMPNAGNFMFIPQQLTAWDVADKTNVAAGTYLSVMCRISSLDGAVSTQLFPATAGEYAYSAVPIDTKWEAGKKYIYTLEFFGANGGGGTVDPEDPTGGGEDILGKPITFTVKLNDWVAAAGADVHL